MKEEILAIIKTRIEELKQGDIYFCNVCRDRYKDRTTCAKCHRKLTKKPAMFKLRDSANRANELEKLKLSIEEMDEAR